REGAFRKRQDGLGERQTAYGAKGQGSRKRACKTRGTHNQTGSAGEYSSASRRVALRFAGHPRKEGRGRDLRSLEEHKEFLDCGRDCAGSGRGRVLRVGAAASGHQLAFPAEPDFGSRKAGCPGSSTGTDSGDAFTRSSPTRCHHPGSVNCNSWHTG